MTVERRQEKLQANSDAIERWQRKLFRAANELQKLAKERKRLLGPKRPSEGKPRKMTLDEIRQRAGAYGGNDFHSDDIPL